MSSDDQEEVEYVATLREAGEALGVSERTCKAYVAELLIEKEPAGWPMDVLRELHESKLYARGKDRSPASERLLKARIAERRAKSAIAGIERAVQEGKLIPAAEARDRTVARIRCVRARFLEWERSLAPRLVGLRPAEIKPILEKELATVLEVWRRMP